MANTTKLGRSQGTRSKFLGGAATTLALVAMGANVAHAQDDADADAFNLEEIVVTGSLIKNPNLTRSAPVAVISTEEMAYQQTNVAEEILREIPGVTPSVGSNVNNGNGGFSYVNLRNLGSNRNVVLIDGRRASPSELQGRFDLNNIPLALIERVDVLTGGASTTYGADAIAGVVNFVTKKNFEGIEVRAGYGTTEQGDGDTQRFELTFGSGLEDGKGNVVMSIGYQKADEVFQGDRDFSENVLLEGSGTTAGSGLGPFNTRFGNVNVTGEDHDVPGGQLRNIGLAGVQDDRTFGNGQGDFTPFNYAPFNLFQVPFERFNIYTAAEYEIAEGVEAYARGIYSRNQVDTIIAPSGSFGDSVTVSLAHPFLSDQQRNAFCAFDTNSGAGYTPLFSQAECDAAATATSRSDPNYREVDTQLRRRNVEGGPRISNYRADYFDMQVGVRGDLTDTIAWDIMGSYGESEQTQIQKAYWLKSRFRQSLLSGPDGCFDPSNGCVPVDFFGPTGSITEEQTGFLQGGESAITIGFDMSQIVGNISGEVGYALPWATDSVNFAFGAEYRDYNATRESDLLSQSGDLGGAGGAAPNIEGGFSVYEAVAEVLVPIVQDADWAKELTFEAGIRYSDYSIDTAGDPGYDTWTWKLGASWSPIDDVTIRGGFSRAVRAPNIAELFTPQVTLLTNLNDDPCASINDDGTTNGNVPTGTLRDVCIAQGAPAGAIGSIPQPAAGQANYTGGGDVNLQPESSDSWTVGIILQPEAIPGLTITADYYKITIEGSINAPTPGDAISLCFDQNLSVSNPNCTAIVRSPIDGGLAGDENVVKGLPLFNSNLGNFATDGIDFSVAYSRPITDTVDWRTNFVGNWTNSRTFQAITGVTENRECVGLYGPNCTSIQPDLTFNWRNTVTWDKLDVSLLWRFIANAQYEDPSRTLFSGVPEGLDKEFDFNETGNYSIFDLSIQYRVFENVTLTGTVSNLFDVHPPLVGAFTGSTSFNSGNTYPSTFDALGRRYGIQARVTF